MDADARQSGDETDSLDIDLQGLWETSLPRLRQSLDLIDQCVEMWRARAADPGVVLFDPDLLGAARRETHQLAGSLGIFNLREAVDMASRLGRLLVWAPRLEAAVAAFSIAQGLRKVIEIGPKVRPAGSDAWSPAEMTGQAGVLVLLAEDDEIIAGAVRTALRLDGLELRWATDGVQAIQMSSDQYFDLALVDLDLPLADGLEVCRRLRSDPRSASVPILLMTGYSDPQLVVDRIPAGGVASYLRKPFKVADLRARVRELLSQNAPPAA